MKPIFILSVIIFATSFEAGAADLKIPKLRHKAVSRETIGARPGRMAPHAPLPIPRSLGRLLEEGAGRAIGMP